MNLQKIITIVDLKPKTGMRKDKSGMWTKYLIKGNDGFVYETWDQNWFLQRKIGETINIEYWTSTYQGQNGIRTTYNLVIEPSNQQTQPPLPSRVNPGINPQVAAILAELKKVETNIIAAIRVHSGNNLNIPEQKTTVGFDIARNTIPIIQENGFGGVTTEDEEPLDKNPF